MFIDGLLVGFLCGGALIGFIVFLTVRNKPQPGEGSGGGSGGGDNGEGNGGDSGGLDDNQVFN